MTQRYDVFDEAKGRPRRSSYVVDKRGMVRWAVHNPTSEGRDLDEHLRQLHASRTRSPRPVGANFRNIFDRRMQTC